LHPVLAAAPQEGAGQMKIIYVITDEQILYAWEGNKLVYEFDVVTGLPTRHLCFA
jgi:hypothetical protein